MQTHKRRHYTDTFKQEAVRMVTDRGYSASDTAKRLDINTNMLRRWKRQAETSSGGVFAGSGHRSEEQEELIHLRKEVKRLRMEREILLIILRALGVFDLC
jgi:transposase